MPMCYAPYKKVYYYYYYHYYDYVFLPTCVQFSNVDIDEPLFQPFPSEVTFQQFEPHIIYEVPLLLRNNDKVLKKKKNIL